MNSSTSSTASAASALALTTSALSGQDGLDRRDELVLGDPLDGGGGDRVVLPLALEELLRRGDREHGEARVPDRVDAPVLRDADELERPLRLQGRDLDRVADRVAVVVGRSGIDDDLVLGGGPSALEEVQRVELGERGIGVDAEPEASARPPSSLPRPRGSGSSCCARRGSTRSRARPGRRRAPSRAATRRRAGSVAPRRRSRCPALARSRPRRFPRTTP